MTKCQEYLRLRDGSAGLHRKAGCGDATCTCSPALCGVDRGLLGLAGHQFNFRFRERLSVKGIIRAENERSGHTASGLYRCALVHRLTYVHLSTPPPPHTHKRWFMAFLSSSKSLHPKSQVYRNVQTRERLCQHKKRSQANARL